MSTVPFDPEAVRTLATILAESGLTEIEIEGKEGRIRVVRAPAVMAQMASVPVAAPLAAMASPPPASPPTSPAEEAVHPGAVLSPMVGIAYLSAEPGAAPYVTVGQAVSVGQTLMLIEAMKTFNQIKATRAGTVTRILAQPNVPVEFGEPLMIVE